MDFNVDSLDIGYRFKNINLIKTAFIHTSYSYEQNKKIANNERLEFLGDAVLELTISEYIYKHYPDFPEGEMTKVRASVVCEKSLHEVAVKHNFSNFLIVGKCEDKGSNGKRKPSMLADSVEAVIGAIYLDGGYGKSKKFILENLEEKIKEAVKGIGFKDYKTTLQEELQKNPDCKIEYEVIKEEGPQHNKMFYVEMLYNGKKLGQGAGKTKKEAEQQAAQEALEVILSEE